MFFLAVLDGPMTSLDSFLKLLCGFRVVVPDKEVSLERVVLHHLVLIKVVLVEIILKLVANSFLNGTAEDVIMFNLLRKVAEK